MISVPRLPAVAQVLRSEAAPRRHALAKRSFLAANLGALCAVLAIAAGYLAT
jgi:hypothetical protein